MEPTSESKSELEPFLSDKDTKQEWSTHGKHYSNFFNPTNIILHTCLIILYTILTALMIWNQRISTLHDDALKHLTIIPVQKLFASLKDNPYAGVPSSSVDEAWGELLKDINIRVYEHELKQHDQTSISLGPDRGYLAWLGVYHDLHCLKTLRQWMYRESYYPNLTEAERYHWERHADHCVDVIRQSLTCHADLSITTFEWTPRHKKPMFNGTTAVHTCTDWDALTESISDRIISEEEMANLVNPIFDGGA